MISYLLAGMAGRLEVGPGLQSEHNLQQERGFQVFSSDGGRRSFSTSSGRVVDAVVDKNNCERTKRGLLLVAGLARIAAISNGGV